VIFQTQFYKILHIVNIYLNFATHAAHPHNSYIENYCYKVYDFNVVCLYGHVKFTEAKYELCNVKCTSSFVWTLWNVCITLDWNKICLSWVFVLCDVLSEKFAYQYSSFNHPLAWAVMGRIHHIKPFLLYCQPHFHMMNLFSQTRLRNQDMVQVMCSKCHMLLKC
jgi:hypothetical protein